MSYKKGDRVKIKNIDWYNKNKDQYGRVACGYHVFTEEMSKFCGYTMIVCHRSNLGVMTMGGSASYWTDEMIEGLADELIEKTDDNQQTDLGIKMVSVDEVCNWLRNPLNFLQGGSEKLPDVIPIFNTIDEMVNDFLKITKK